MWVTDHFPHRPLPIARHGGNKPIPTHARKVVRNGLEADVFAWKEWLIQFEQQKNGNGGASGGPEGNS
jgi:hypothetical protein